MLKKKTSICSKFDVVIIYYVIEKLSDLHLIANFYVCNISLINIHNWYVRFKAITSLTRAINIPVDIH